MKLNLKNCENFNSHAHVERDADLMNMNVNVVNFNSHAHVERDTPGGGSFFSFIISTHTLTWSVTFGVAVRSLWLFISTHTLTWSVTCLALTTSLTK